MPNPVIARPRRWEMLRSGFSNWQLAAFLAFVDHRTSRLRAGEPGRVSRLQCALRTRSGTRLVARVQDLNAPAEVFGRSEYALEGLDWSAVEYVLDLGGHVGSFTLWAAERSPARFLVLEPNPAVFELLEQNVRGLGERVSLERAAVAAEPGTGWFELDVDSASSRLRPAASKEAPGSLRVGTVTLAQVVAASGFPHVDVVKMDIEGAEYPVLRSAGPDLLCAGRRWVVECHPGHDGDPDEVVRLFEAAGFRAEVAAKPEGLALVTAVRTD